MTRGLVRAGLGALLALIALRPGVAQEQLRPFAGRVVGITDDDTLSVMKENATVTVRLEGIDAPDQGQAFSQAAKQELSDIAYGRVACVYPKERDRYDRIVGRVVADNRDLSEHMVLAGFAWRYTTYSSDPVLAALRRDDQAAPRGMWVDPSNRPPWEYRKAQRQRPTEEPKEVPVIRQSGTVAQTKAAQRSSSTPATHLPRQHLEQDLPRPLVSALQLQELHSCLPRPSGGHPGRVQTGEGV